MLAGRRVERVDAGSYDEDAFILELDHDDDDVLAAWQTARAAVVDAGVWPVVAWDITGDLFNRWPYHHGRAPVEDHLPVEICERAGDLDAEDVIEARRNQIPDWPAEDNQIEWHLDRTWGYFGAAPTLHEVIDALGEEPGHRVLERWLFEWEMATGVSPTIDDSYLSWGAAADRLRLVLLPTPAPWEVPAYISFYGAEGTGGAERLIAVLRGWHDWFGAELVAHYGTALQFVVDRPPETPEAAWTLAWEQELTASCTTAPMGTVRHHAWVLMGHNTWLLQDRP